MKPALRALCAVAAAGLGAGAVYASGASDVLPAGLRLTAASTASSAPAPDAVTSPTGASAGTSSARPKVTSGSVAGAVQTAPGRTTTTSRRRIVVPTGATTPSTTRGSGTFPIAPPRARPMKPPYPWASAQPTTRELALADTCLPVAGGSNRPPLVAAANGSEVRLTWRHSGHPGVRAYVVSWYQVNRAIGAARDVRSERITPPSGCRDVSTTVGGLAPGRYVFQLAMEQSTPEAFQKVTTMVLNSAGLTVS